ncbi:hypothetical protein [Prevotella pallens]
MNRAPMECALRLFMCNQCLFHEYMIFVLVHPTVIRGVIIQFGVNGRDESAPTPTECTLQLFMYTQRLHPRTPTVGADLSCPHITECTVWIVHAYQCLILVHPL